MFSLAICLKKEYYNRKSAFSLDRAIWHEKYEPPKKGRSRMKNDELKKNEKEFGIIKQALQKEMVGVKVVVDTMRALIVIVVEKGIVTKEEIARRAAAKKRK